MIKTKASQLLQRGRYGIYFNSTTHCVQRSACYVHSFASHSLVLSCRTSLSPSGVHLFLSHTQSLLVLFLFSVTSRSLLAFVHFSSSSSSSSSSPSSSCLSHFLFLSLYSSLLCITRPTCGINMAQETFSSSCICRGKRAFQ